MRRTAADRQAEAARYQQMTEQDASPKEQMSNAIDAEVQALRVQDRKTGEMYNPQDRFDQLMNKPEIQAMLKRLAVR